MRREILAAAEELFAIRGYAGTTTKEIARAAQTTETGIFRAFNSKRELFNAAILAPLEEFMAHYAQDWLPNPRRHGTPEEALRQFAEELYSLVIGHRQLFSALVANGLVGTDAQPVFARLEKVSDRIKVEHGLSWDTPIAARAMVGMVVSMAMFEDVLYPSSRRPSRKRIVDELTRILIGAAGLSPAPDEVAPRRSS